MFESSLRRSLEEFKQDLAGAEAERDTLIKLLQSQLTAAEKQRELRETRVNAFRCRDRRATTC